MQPPCPFLNYHISCSFKVTTDCSACLHTLFPSLNFFARAESALLALLCFQQVSRQLARSRSAEYRRTITAMQVPHAARSSSMPWVSPAFPRVVVAESDMPLLQQSEMRELGSTIHRSIVPLLKRDRAKWLKKNDWGIHSQIKVMRTNHCKRDHQQSNKISLIIDQRMKLSLSRVGNTNHKSMKIDLPPDISVDGVARCFS